MVFKKNKKNPHILFVLRPALSEQDPKSCFRLITSFLEHVNLLLCVRSQVLFAEQLLQGF